MNVLHLNVFSLLSWTSPPAFKLNTTSKTIYKFLNEDASWVISEGLNKCLLSESTNLKSPLYSNIFL